MAAEISTTDTRLAAALGTLGVVARPEVLLDDHTGREEVTFHLGLKGLIPGMEVNTSVIRKGLKDKSLDVCHPVLDCFRALHNRKVLLDFLKSGVRFRLGSAAGGRRSVFVQGGDVGLPGRVAGVRCVRTMDVGVVAAMGVMGVMPLAVEGSGSEKAFYLPMVGESLLGADGLPFVEDVAALLRDFRDGTLARERPEHAFLYGVLAIRNYGRLLESVNRVSALVLLRKRQSKKAAYVREDASDKAFDTVRRHFGV